MSWAAWELGVWSWGCAPDAAVDQAGGRSIAHQPTRASRWPAGLVGDQAAYRLLDNPAVGGGRFWRSPSGRWNGWQASQWCCAFRTQRN